MNNIDISALDVPVSKYHELDPSGMCNRLRDVPPLCQEAWATAMEASLPKQMKSVNQVVIGGMGGSGIAGELVADLFCNQSIVPITVVRDSHFPFAIDQNTLFIACSHSGKTRETLSLFRYALKGGAQVLAVTGGGDLAKEAEEQGVPILPIEAPGEPRTAVACNLILLLVALGRMGILNISEQEIADAVVMLQKGTGQFGEHVPSSKNLAKQLAWELKDKIIIVYAGGIFSGMARRWKTQINENAKMWAFSERIPEVLHNAVEAYVQSMAPRPDAFVLILQPNYLAGLLDYPYDAVSHALQIADVPYRVLQAEWNSEIAQLFYMLSLGDYVSYYLAILQGLDPSETSMINMGKEFLDAAMRNEWGGQPG